MKKYFRVRCKDIKFQCWKFSYAAPTLKAAFHLQVFKKYMYLEYSESIMFSSVITLILHD